MRKTNIQWCHSTVNPVMGCDGCELWPAAGPMLQNLKNVILNSPNPPPREAVAKAIGDARENFPLTSRLHASRNAVAAGLANRLNLTPPVRDQLTAAIRSQCKCYAGLLGTMRPGHPGYAGNFEKPELFPGRMAAAARWVPPSADEHAAKPWLTAARRMIFVSDMGDALSQNVPFDYLKTEIIGAVNSAAGSRHLWLWLTKRPGRMAEFGRWLANLGEVWPDNLVAMTTVTSNDNRARVDELRQVPAKFKNLSCEPVFSELDLNLSGIDWLITGGGSDIFGEPFHVEWALRLHECCRKSGTAFFLKQLGKNPFFNGQPLKLGDPHGGEWNHWPDPAWRVREIPAGFKTDFHARADGATRFAPDPGQG